MEDTSKVTDSQKKQISKVFFNAKIRLFLIGIKFSVALFLANMACFLFGNWLLKDSNPEVVPGFNAITFIINFSFMVGYLDSQCRKNSDIVKEKVLEILKKQ